MSTITIIGAQWGDEGKGKIVDWLCDQADAVIRFQGGHNAGHTLVVEGVTYKLSLLPSGIVRPGKLGVIGNGVVINPWALLEEINKIQDQGLKISTQNLLISESACLILPPHWQIDQAREIAQGAGKIGTTGRGIGPAYEDKVARRAIRVCDLADADLLETKIRKLLAHHNIFLKAYGVSEIDPEALWRDLIGIAPKILPYVRSSVEISTQLAGKNILCEGAQGVMLDIDHGTYPFVTSSSTVAANAMVGSGLRRKDHRVLGVAKAYCTRVGSGPFPSKTLDERELILGQRGHEFGTVTGRKRDCGWFDAVQMRHAIRVGGIDSLALTKIDVLDTLSEIPVCVSYELEGQKLGHFPASQSQQASITPVYENLPGWQSSTQGIGNWGDLPSAAKAYVKRLEELIGVPIEFVSTGPERESILVSGLKS